MQPHYTLEFAFSDQLARLSRSALDRVLLRSPLNQSDRNKIQLALSEIATNLIRHSPVKPNKLQLECQWNDQLFELRIKDDGSPVPQSAMEPDLEAILAGDVQTGGYGMAMLFDQFQQINYSTSDKGINQWTLGIPLERENKRQHILLVDDDLIQLQMLEMYLEAHQVTAFSSASEALEWLQKNQPDLIISDICMPELDGLEFRNRIHQIRHLNLTPFVFLTGDNDEQLAQKLVQEGIDDYLLKPITKEHLNRIAERVLRRHKDLVRRTYALVDHELKHHLRKDLTGLGNEHYQVTSLAFSAHLGGGDYWLAQKDSDHLDLLLGDVMGHDLQACFMAGRQQGFFQAITSQVDTESIQTAQQVTSTSTGTEYLQRFSDWLDKHQPELLTTISLMMTTPDQVAFYNAGSPPALWLTQDDTVASLPNTGALPGLGCSSDFAPCTLSLKSGERMVLFSDGLIEISSDYQQQQQRISQLIGLLSKHRHYSLSELTHQLQQQIEQNPISDDISVIIIEKR